MKYGSLVNNLMSGPSSIEPALNEGATILMHSDRRAATVVAIRRYTTGPKKGQAREVIVRADKATVISGSAHDGSAQYEHTYDPDGTDLVFHRTRKGAWTSKSGDSLAIGFRQTYRDPSF